MYRLGEYIDHITPDTVIYRPEGSLPLTLILLGLLAFVAWRVSR